MTSSNNPPQCIASATRRSIQEHFPLGTIMCSGSNNPITLHSSVDKELFASVWSLIGETMVVTGELPRSTKEAIATLVSERNECPVCIKAHSMMGIVATNVDAASKSTQHTQALDYAELLIYQVNAQRSVCLDLTRTSSSIRVCPRTMDTSCWDAHLSEGVKAEVALVVALFLHVNRVVSAILGEYMSTAMMSIPAPLAKVMETMGTVQTMGKLLSPLLAGTFRSQPHEGFTQSLFPKDDDNTPSLPPGLQTLLQAGPERAKAVARLIQWVAHYESDLLLEGDIFDYDLIKFVDEHVRTTKDDLGTSKEALQWIQDTVEKEYHGNDDEPVEEWNKALATVLILITLAPKAIYKSQPWKILVAQWGEAQARSIVVFWSLRTTLQEAHILFSEVGEEEEEMDAGSDKTAVSCSTSGDI